jgi:hypothetical protein
MLTFPSFPASMASICPLLNCECPEALYNLTSETFPVSDSFLVCILVLQGERFTLASSLPHVWFIYCLLYAFRISDQ